MRVLGSTAYAELSQHRPRFIAELIGISRTDEQRSLMLLRRAGAVYKQGGRCRVVDATSVARDRVPDRRRGREYYAYNVCALSAPDFGRLREVWARAFAEIRSIVAASNPEERVALVTLQLLDLARM